MKCVECGKDLSDQEEQCDFGTCSYCELGIPRPRVSEGKAMSTIVTPKPREQESFPPIGIDDN